MKTATDSRVLMFKNDRRNFIRPFRIVAIDTLAVFELIGEHMQREGCSAPCGILARGAVRQHPWKLLDLRDPAAISFAVEVNREDKASGSLGEHRDAPPKELEDARHRLLHSISVRRNQQLKGSASANLGTFVPGGEGAGHG